ncbi:hypothetical protein NIES4106_62050 (plasmid) [Fischerella sp. NIES-4106]|nr:hypothetical protein NIES4106_62050 [Fischerella sp. NIES-4106]
MARAKKSQTTAQTTVEQQPNDGMTIAAACSELNTTEQSFRLALADIRDDFDTCEFTTQQELGMVREKLQTKALPTMEEQIESTEEPTEQPEQQPEENTNLPAVQDQQLPTQPPQQQQNSGLSLQEMLVKAASEEIQILDAIQQAKNQVIVNNYLARKSELTEAINQDWQVNKAGHFGVLQQFPGMARPRVEITPDEVNVAEEINTILGELSELTSPGV